MPYIGYITDKCITFDENLNVMNHSVLSADIVAYTSLSDKEKTKIDEVLNDLTNILNNRFGTFSRVIKGDQVECYIEDPEDSLRIALIYKSKMKTITIRNKNKSSRISAFNTYAIRIAIGIGNINRLDREKGIIDGDAIYLSGRTLTELGSTSDKSKVTIKNTIYLRSYSNELNEEMEPLISLIDVLINNATAKQCEILYHKLLGKSEESISSILGIGQSTINEHSTKLGWNAIDKALSRFETVLKKIKYDNL